MCGGIVGALDMGLRQPGRSNISMFGYHLAYNCGRIISYIVVGGLAGYLGAGIAQMSPALKFPLGSMITAIFLIALGLYLANWWRVLSILEKLGSHVWQKIQPIGQKLLPVQDHTQAFGVGLIWGWLPCGLVYTAIAWSLTTGEPIKAAILMLGFGLGTLPTMLFIGSSLGRLNTLIRKQQVRTAAGVIIIAFGIYIAVSSFSQPGQHNHQHMQHTL
ncbi:MAG: sulfite exporter TauE/SafE family protein [Gammaproteobacteria bacterium]|nr:sulfite exporter TauE/SafE family protein [Gammaproteobacteria bacterium]